MQAFETSEHWLCGNHDSRNLPIITRCCAIKEHKTCRDWECQVPRCKGNFPDFFQTFWSILTLPDRFRFHDFSRFPRFPVKLATLPLIHWQELTRISITGDGLCIQLAQWSKINLNSRRVNNLFIFSVFIWSKIPYKRFDSSLQKQLTATCNIQIQATMYFIHCCYDTQQLMLANSKIVLWSKWGIVRDLFMGGAASRGVARRIPHPF